MRPLGPAVYLQETIEIPPAQGKPARCTEQGYGRQLFAIRLLSNAGGNGTLGTNARLSARKIRAAGDAAGGPIPVAERLSPLGRSGIHRMSSMCRFFRNAIVRQFHLVEDGYEP